MTETASAAPEPGELPHAPEPPEAPSLQFANTCAQRQMGYVFEQTQQMG